MLRKASFCILSGKKTAIPSLGTWLAISILRFSFVMIFSKTGVHVYSLVVHKYSFRRFGRLRQLAA